MEALEQYKAQRPPMDEELKAQFPVIENLLAAMNVPVVALPGWEGDDILGTVAARDEELGYRTLLVTGDKDAYQLASDLTKIVTTKQRNYRCRYLRSRRSGGALWCNARSVHGFSGAQRRQSR